MTSQKRQKITILCPNIYLRVSYIEFKIVLSESPITRRLFDQFQKKKKTMVWAPATLQL